MRTSRFLIATLAVLSVVARLAGAEITSTEVTKSTGARGTTRELTDKELADRMEQVAAEIQARRAARLRGEANGETSIRILTSEKPAAAKRVSFSESPVSTVAGFLAQRSGIELVNQSSRGATQISCAFPETLPAPQIEAAAAELLRLHGFALTKSATAWTLADTPDASAQIVAATRDKPLEQRLAATLHALSESEMVEASMKDMDLQPFLQFFGQMCGREILADNSLPALHFSQNYTKATRREVVAQFDAALVARGIYSYEFGEHFLVVCYTPPK